MTENYKEIFSGIYWIGSEVQESGLRMNTYLILDNEEAILIDPGSISGYEDTVACIKQITSLDKIKYVVLHNLSPIVANSLSLFVYQGVNAKIVVQQKAVNHLKSYSVDFDYYLIDEHENKLVLKSNREFRFFESPYLPYLESFITYDCHSKILFSSFLFSASPRRWNLFADKIFYKESMKAVHEQYISGNKFLRPVMDVIMKIHSEIGISMIATAHGSIIDENIPTFINILKGLNCGIAFNPIKNDLTRKEGYITLSNEILEIYFANFSKEDVLEIFANSAIQIDKKSLSIVAYEGAGEELWEQLFNLIYTSKGIRWLSIAYEHVMNIVQSYNAKKPDVFNLREKELIKLDIENIKLKEEISKLEENLQRASENLTKDSTTNLYNEPFFRNFIKNILYKEDNKNNFILLICEIDDVWKIKKKYGSQGDSKIIRIIKILADILKIYASDKGYQLFKISSEGAFIFYLPIDIIENAIHFADEIRNSVAGSARFQENITISSGIVSTKEFGEEIINENLILLIAFTRLGMAKKIGSNQIVHKSEIEKFIHRKILIVETDEIYINLLKSALEQYNFKVETCQNVENAIEILENTKPELVIAELELKSDLKILSCEDGYMASKIIENEKPDLVISELMIPKDNGLAVRERMLQVSNNQNIPFILISHLKDETTVERAFKLKVDYYLKKPFLINELTGIVRNILHK